MPERDLLNHPVFRTGDGIKEPQCTNCLVELAPGGVKFVDHPKLKVSDLFWAKLFRVLSVSHGESIDVIGVGVDRSRR
jgi:hypothetical protein